MERDKQYVAGTYNRFPVSVVSGKGSVCYDENGNTSEYTDFITKTIGEEKTNVAKNYLLEINPNIKIVLKFYLKYLFRNFKNKKYKNVKRRK